MKNAHDANAPDMVRPLETMPPLLCGMSPISGAICNAAEGLARLRGRGGRRESV